MVVMKRCMFIAGCFFLSICQAMERPLRRVEERDIPNMIGKLVVFESFTTKQYEKGFLDKPVSSNPRFYTVFTDTSQEGQRKGTVCLENKIFYVNDDK